MRINRLFEIVYLLLDKERMTASELSERFEVSTRTIYRDIEILSAAGIPIYMSKGKGGGISLLPNYVLNKTVLTEDEKSGILSSLRAMNSLHPEKTDTALSKLGSLLGEQNTDWIEVDFMDWSNREEERILFETLKNAILHRNVICFQYFSNRREQTKRMVLPLKICFKSRSWYLYGFCRARKDYRFFKLSRIKEVEVTDENFELKVPGKVLMGLPPLNQEMITVTLRIQREMAYRVFDEFPTCEELESGDFLCEMTAPYGSWMIDFVCSYGEFGEVLAPEFIREQVIDRLQKSLKKYL